MMLDLGVSSAEDLQLCDSCDFVAMAKHLRKIPHKRFLAAVNVDDTTEDMKADEATISEDIFGDLSTSVAPLLMFLDREPAGSSVTRAVLGPGPCLLQAAPANAGWTAQMLLSLLEMHRFDVESIEVGGLSADHKLALRLYSLEQPVKFYEVLNAPYKVKRRSPDLISCQAPFSRILIEAIRSLSANPDYLYEGIAYRGIYAAGNSPFHLELQRKFDNHQQAFRVGSRLTFAPFTSLTLSENVAEGFGDTIFYVFTHVRGVRMNRLSAFGDTEYEILLEPPSVFEVVACAKLKGVLQVTLKSVSSPLKYLS